MNESIGIAARNLPKALLLKERAAMGATKARSRVWCSKYEDGPGPEAKIIDGG